MAAPAAPIVKRDSALVEKHVWLDVQGRQIEASIRAVQLAFTTATFTPSSADCLRLIMAAKSRGWDLWNGDIQMVGYQAGQPAGLVTNYLMFTAEAQKAGGLDYLPPEFDIKIGEDGFPTEGRVQMRRASWPKGTFRRYPVDGGYVRFQDIAPKVKREGKEQLRATWATPGSGRHMFAKTLEARVTRLVWADATRGLYLREEMGTFRMPQDATPRPLLDEPEPEVAVDTPAEDVMDVDFSDTGEVGDGLDLPKPAPRDLCPVHKQPWKHVQTGQYDFWTCPAPKGRPGFEGRNAKGYCSQKPPEGYDGPTEAAEEAQTAQEPPAEAETPESTPDPEPANTEAPAGDFTGSDAAPALTDGEMVTALRVEMQRVSPTPDGKLSQVVGAWVKAHWEGAVPATVLKMVLADPARCQAMLLELKGMADGALT